MRTVLNFVIPVVIFPYVSRVLGPVGLGKVEFANSIVSYFVLFTALGIPNYGIREIARKRDDVVERSKTVWELTIILLTTIGIGYIVYFLTVWFIPRLHTEYLLFCIVAPTIFLSDFSYEWFYTGIEDQLYITIRYIIIKIIQIICVFCFVKGSSQYYVYAAVLVGMNSISTVFNVIHMRKYVVHIPFKQLNVKQHMKPVLIIFISVVAINIYTHLDVTMVGFMVGDRAVGLYTTANKFIRIVLTLVTALSTVMIPRIENSLKKGDMPAYKKYLNTSLDYILILAVPCCFGIIALAPDIIELFAGKSYLDAVVSIKMLSPIVIIVGLANFTGLQVLYPRREEWKYTVAVSVAAVVNAISNSLLIPRFAQNGAIIGTLIAEGTGLSIQIVYAWKYLIKTDLFSINSCKYIISGIVMYIVLIVISPFFSSILFHCLVSFFVAILIYGIMLLILRENLIIEIINRKIGFFEK
jgi:O-antigen/teichoic acid export membrane protein